MAVPASLVDPRFPGTELADRYRIAFALLAMRDGRTIEARTYLPPAACIDDEPILWLGCLSKPITAAAVMLLVDRGLLTLSDPLRRFMPDLSPRLGDLTVQALLAHQTRLPRNMPQWGSFFDEHWLAEPLRSAVLRIDEPEPSAPGQRSYSSVGYVLLGRLVEVVAASELSAFVASELFARLEMRDSCGISAIPPHAALRMPPVLARAGGTVSVLFDPARSHAVKNSMPFAGFFSTPRDLSRFVQMMLNRGSSGGRQLLREETVDRMFHEEVTGQGIHQGLAWFLSFSRDDEGRSKPSGFWHTSSSGGLIAANRANESAVIILTQAFLTDDLTPVRVTEWHYARQITGTDPAPPNTPARVDMPAWFGELEKSVGGERCGSSRSGSDQ